MLKYQINSIKKGDKIKVQLFVQLAKDECMSIVKINKEINKALLMKNIEKIWL